MSLHILQHKSWHVWNEKNITKVRQDEAKAKLKDDEKEKKFLAAEAEARLVRLRRAATGDASKDVLAPELDLLGPPPPDAVGDAGYEAEQAKKQDRERRALGIRDLKFEDVTKLAPWYATASTAQAEQQLRQQQLQRQRPRGGRAPLQIPAGGDDEDPLVVMRARVATARAAEERSLDFALPPSLSVADSRARIQGLGRVDSPGARSGGRGPSRWDQQVIPNTNAGLQMFNPAGADPTTAPSSHAASAPGPPLAAENSSAIAEHRARRHRSRSRSRSRTKQRRSRSGSESREEAGEARKHHRHRHHRHRHRHSREGDDRPRAASHGGPTAVLCPEAQPAAVAGAGATADGPSGSGSSWDRLRLERLMREAEEHQRANSALMRAAEVTGVQSRAMGGPHPTTSTDVSASAIAQALLETVGRAPSSSAALSSQFNPHLARNRADGSGRGRWSR